MRKLLLTTVILLLANGLKAQSPYHEIEQNIRCSAGIDMAYPGATQWKQTPAPEGWKPFYISHFGRYGSCYLPDAQSYEVPYRILLEADTLGKLTTLGHDIMLRLDRIRRDADGRWGELTELGGHQHRQIMRRMMNRFPAVFTDGAVVNGRSTTDIPCILSMEHAMGQVAQNRPLVQIYHYATGRDMSYLDRHGNTDVLADSTVRTAFEALAQKCQSSQRLMETLFCDADYVRDHVDADRFSELLFRVASSIQNTELRKTMTLYDLFTDQEVCCHWELQNARTFATYGSYPPAPAPYPTPTTQCDLLRKIIAQADSYIRHQTHGAHLRYGSEHALLPFLCLLNVNGCGVTLTDLDAIDKKGWADFKLCPMAANIQFVFYAPEEMRVDNVLVKVLLNEVEARLPLKTTLYPYYHWTDVRDYYLKKIANFEEIDK